MTFHKLDELPASSADDGRESRRIVAATVGVSRVEWPAGTTTTAHNHANELVVVLLEGRLKAISGDREFILGPVSWSSSRPTWNITTRLWRTR